MEHRLALHAPTPSAISERAIQGRPLALYALIASLPFSDFLQTGVVAFSAAPVMGSIGASPEEYSLVATLYAVVAIGVILAQRKLVERLGWLRLVQGSSALFAIGALACGASEGLTGFAFGRVLMAMGCASFMTSGRVLVNRIAPSPRRFTGIRFFGSGLAWGVVAGPVAASIALSSHGWRGAFFAMLIPAAAMAALAAVCLERTRPSNPVSGEPRSSESIRPARPIALLTLMGAAFLILHALQRSTFDFFSNPATVAAWAALAPLAVWLFVRLERRHLHPLIGLQGLLRRRYLTGLGVFALCYVVLGANNTVLPLLLQRVLAVPLESVGLYLGAGSLAGVASLIVLFRCLPRHPGPTRYYLAGFGALMLCGYQLSSLSESANPWTSVMPALLCNGAFVIIALATTAMRTLLAVPQDERSFSHANQVKNILAQFGVAAGMAVATLCMQWRSSLHFAQLSENLNPSNPVLQQTLDRWTRFFETTNDPANAPRLALHQVGAWVTNEATFMATIDYFFLVFLVAGASLTVVLLSRAWRERANRIAGSEPRIGSASTCLTAPAAARPSDSR